MANRGKSGNAAAKRPTRKTNGTKGKAKASAPRRWHRRLINWFGTLIIWGFVVVTVVVGYYAYDLPDVSKMERLDRAPLVTMRALDGSAIASYGGLYGETIQLGALPRDLKHAVMATEDRRFYGHFGVDIIGMARSAWANWQAGRIVQGGSTLTQQLAKNLFLSPARTIKRKVQEILLALYLESQFSKDQIFTLYLNRVYLGAGTYGVDAAARKYFDKSARRLNLTESAMVAGLLKAPSRYAPTNNLKAAQKRSIQVLVNMQAAGYIDQATLAVARQRPAGLAPRRAQAGSTRYFADWALESIKDLLGPVGRDIVVTTSLDSSLQKMAEDALTTELAKHGKTQGIGQGAVVVMTPDGAIKAMVGGQDYAASQFNRAAQARRQPGSAFKPFVYLTALQAGLGPEDGMIDQAVDVQGWRPRNYSGRFTGPVTLRQALAQSINSVAVQVAERVGRAKVIDNAHRLGVVSNLRNHPSIALGTSEVTLIEMTTAYAHFANGGIGVLPYAVIDIRDRNGVQLYHRGGSGIGRVIEENDAYRMTDMLITALESGTGKAARIGRPAAGKTGTSQDFRDAWFIGYTPDLVAGIWVGNDNARAMKRVTGGGAPARIWRRFMAAAGAATTPRPFPKPGPADAFQGLFRRLVDQFGGGSDGGASQSGKQGGADGGP